MADKPSAAPAIAPTPAPETDVQHLERIQKELTEFTASVNAIPDAATKAHFLEEIGTIKQPITQENLSDVEKEMARIKKSLEAIANVDVALRPQLWAIENGIKSLREQISKTTDQKYKTYFLAEVGKIEVKVKGWVGSNQVTKANLDAAQSNINVIQTALTLMPSTTVESATAEVKNQQELLRQLGKQVDDNLNLLKIDTRLTMLKHVVMAKMAFARVESNTIDEKKWQAVLDKIEDSQNRIQMARTNDVYRWMLGTGTAAAVHGAVEKAGGFLHGVGEAGSLIWSIAIGPLKAAWNKIGVPFKRWIAKQLRGAGWTGTADFLDAGGAEQEKREQEAQQKLEGMISDIESVTGAGKITRGTDDAKHATRISVAKTTLGTSFPFVKQKYENAAVYYTAIIKTLPPKENYTLQEIADAAETFLKSDALKQENDAAQLAGKPAEDRQWNDQMDRARAALGLDSSLPITKGPQFSASLSDAKTPASVTIPTDSSHFNERKETASEAAKLFKKMLEAKLDAKVVAIGATWELNKNDQKLTVSERAKGFADFNALDALWQKFKASNSKVNTLQGDGGMFTNFPGMKLVVENGTKALHWNEQGEFPTVSNFIEKIDIERVSVFPATWYFNGTAWTSGTPPSA